MHDIIGPVIQKYLEDNGAADICKTHVDKLTQAIVAALPSPIPAKLSARRLTVGSGNVSGELNFTFDGKPIPKFLLLQIEHQPGME